MKKYLLLALIALVFVVTVVAGGFVLYTKLKTASPELEALAAMTSTDEVEVTADSWLVFKPKDAVPRAGFIIYPGGLVDARAYAPTARDIAAEGYLAVIVPMPLNLAVLGSGKATDVIESFLEIDTWAVGGHSLGGAMASQYAHDNPDKVSGLVLWAAYPASSDNLSDSDLAVTSIYGTDDGLASLEEIEDSRPLLPPDTEFVPIEGGNHAQFGWYGPQSGDNPAAISHPEQQAQIVAATVALLERMLSDGTAPQNETGKRTHA